MENQVKLRRVLEEQIIQELAADRYRQAAITFDAYCAAGGYVTLAFLGQTAIMRRKVKVNGL